MTRPMDSMDDPRNERLRETFTSVAEPTGAGERCPDAERLWDSARGRLPRRTNEVLVLHLGECGACAAAWRLARELSAEEPRRRVLAGPAGWFRRPWVPVAAAAAGLIVAAGLVIQLRGVLFQPRSEYRAPTNGCTASLIPQGEPLPRGNCVLRWSACPEGTTYDVRVTTENLDIVTRARELDETQFLVPEASLKAIPPAGRILWQVTAHLPDGSMGESPTYSAELR